MAATTKHQTYSVNRLAARIMLAYLDPNDSEDMRLADGMLLAWRNDEGDLAKPLSLYQTVRVPIESQEDVARLKRAYTRHTQRQKAIGKIQQGPAIL